MERQTIIYTALPNGRPADGTVRLSVFISPRLWNIVPGSGPMTLERFRWFLNWPRQVALARWQVTFDAGQPIDATVEENLPLREDLWQALFRSETRVIPYQFEDYRGTRIQTIESQKLHDFISDLYGRAALDASELPRASDLAEDDAIKQIARPSVPERPLPDEPRPAPIDMGGRPEPAPKPGHGCLWGCLTVPLWPLRLLVRLIRAILRLLGLLENGIPHEGALPSEPVPAPPPAPPLPDPVPLPPPVIPPVSNQQFNDLADFVARWNDTAEEMPSADEIERTFDFHRMIAALGDYPKLLRALGLVVDLRVPIGDAVGATGIVSVSPGFGLTSTDVEVSPRTRYLLDEEAFLAEPRAGSEISNGLLRLEDESMFRVIQTDVVGGGTKLQNAATNLVAYADKDSRPPTMPDRAGLPALRTMGISVVRLKTADELRHAFDRSHALHSAVAKRDQSPQPPEPIDAGAPLPETDELFADDLVRGYRIDIFDSASNKWHSLCEREGKYEFLELMDAAGRQGPAPIRLSDEGFVQFSAAQPRDTSDRRMRVGDALFVWDGWSLCAPRLGRTIMPSPEATDSDVPPPTVVGDVENTPATAFKLVVTFEPKPRSLPRLRFHYQYRIRARICDLAGNSVFDAGDAGFQAGTDDGPGRTALFPFARYEPVSPPAVMLRRPPIEGESLERVVVRTPDVNGTDRESERHIIPPRVSQLMAELHGGFDNVNSPAQSWERARREGADLEQHAKEHTTYENGQMQKALVYEGAQIPTPYLCDPLSRGALLLDSRLPWSDDAVAWNADFNLRVPFDGEWPDRFAFRLRVRAIPGGQAPAAAHWDAANREVTIELPESAQRNVQLNSWFELDDLERMGVWHWAKAAAPPGELSRLEAEAVAGRSWILLPWRTLSLVHAVQRPLQPPHIKEKGLAPVKAKIGHTFATLVGAVTTHVASTGKVDLDASWTDPIDDPLDAIPPRTAESRAHVCEVLVAESDTDTAIVNTDKTLPTHDFGDTKYHRVTYRPTATTRFREYFPASGLSAADLSVSGDGFAVDVKNSSRPAAPKVSYVVPSYEWRDEEAPFGSMSRTRFGGRLRVFVERPWFSSGDGELLGIVYLDGVHFSTLGDEIRPFVTQWGADPAWFAARTAVSAKTTDFKGYATAMSDLSIQESRSRKVSVVGYPVEFDEARNLWFADIQVDPGTAYTPFVRLALARLQPISIEGAHLSPIVLAQFAQLMPQRTASITQQPTSAGADIHVHVKGPTYFQGAIKSGVSRVPVLGRAELEALVQKRTAAVGGGADLGWQTVASTVIAQTAANPGLWDGTMAVSEPLVAGNFRLVLQEHEWHRSDYGAENAGEGRQVTKRIVYVDTFDLG